jgi:hypothetical protein
VRKSATAMPTGTARRSARKLVRSVPKMNGHAPYWPFTGSQVFPVTREKPA